MAPYPGHSMKSVAFANNTSCMDCLDPFHMACPTFGCKGDCDVCLPDRSATIPDPDPASVEVETDLNNKEVSEMDNRLTDTTTLATPEKEVDADDHKPKKKNRYLRKSFWLKVFGITAVTTVFLAVQTYTSQMWSKWYQDK